MYELHTMQIQMHIHACIVFTVIMFLLCIGTLEYIEYFIAIPCLGRRTIRRLGMLSARFCRPN